MKYSILLFVTLVGCTFAAPDKIETRNLLGDLNEFIDLLPVVGIAKIVVKYMGDPEVQKVINYVLSDEFKSLAVEVEATPKYNAVIKYLESAGLPVKKWIKGLRDLLDIPMPFCPTTKSGGIKAMMNEIGDIVDWDSLITFYFTKIDTSPDFKNLIDSMNSEEFKAFAQALAANKRIQSISSKLTTAGLDIAGFIQLLKDFIGLDF